MAFVVVMADAGDDDGIGAPPNECVCGFGLGVFHIQHQTTNEFVSLGI